MTENVRRLHSLPALCDTCRLEQYFNMSYLGVIESRTCLSGCQALEDFEQDQTTTAQSRIKKKSKVDTSTCVGIVARRSTAGDTVYLEQLRESLIVSRLDY